MSARHRLALSDRTQHRNQYGVEAIGTFDWLFRQDIGKGPRDQQDRAILPAAQASMGTDERFEGGDVERDIFDAAVDVLPPLPTMPSPRGCSTEPPDSTRS